MKQTNSRAFWLMGYMLLLLMVGTNIPSPLYAVYKQQWGFSSGMLTLIFATYALLIIPSLLLFGKLSDRYGRKKVLIPGFILSAVGSLLFTLADSLVWLFAARAIQGISVGITSGAATAALSELHPKQGSKLSALVASVATAAGTALGPLIAGVIAEYGPWPTLLPYLVHIVLILPGVVGLLLIPETVPRPSELREHSAKQPGIPGAIRIPFAIGATTVFIAWSVTALFMSLVPSYVTHLLHIHNLAIAGGAVFLMLGASSVAQLTLKRLSQCTSMVAGLILLTTGLVGIVIAVPTQSVLILGLSTIMTGTGQGLAFMGSMTLVTEIAPPQQRASVMSMLYLILYLGVGLPILGVGFGAEQIGLYHSVLIFSCLVGSASLILALFIAIRLRERMLSY